MKRIIFVICLLAAFCGTADALDVGLTGMRDKIFEESSQIKGLMRSSKDLILLNSMWDSCIITVSQIDAYFHMVGIFNSIKKDDLTEEPIYFLSNWLGEIKRTNDLNIKSMDTVSFTPEPATKDHIDKLKNYLGELNDKINTELGKISALRKTVKKKK